MHYAEKINRKADRFKSNMRNKMITELATQFQLGKEFLVKI
jgi:hypothetical protein